MHHFIYKMIDYSFAIMHHDEAMIDWGYTPMHHFINKMMHHGEDMIDPSK